MPRKYQRIAGSRCYGDYLAETLELCLQEIRDCKITQREAAKKYEIPRSTLKNKLKNHHTGTVGRQPVFSEIEEESFVQHMIKLSDYSFSS